MDANAANTGLADAVAQLKWLTHERELKLGAGDWVAAQAMERRRWLIANEIFKDPQAISDNPQLRSDLEDVAETDRRALKTVRQRQQSVGGDMNYLRRGRQAADAYQLQAGS